jgi:hypothetical protein
MNVVPRRGDHDRRHDNIANLEVVRLERGVVLRRRPDLRFVHVGPLRRLGADLDRDHCAEADQTNKNEPDDASHDASRRHRADRYSAAQKSI